MSEKTFQYIDDLGDVSSRYDTFIVDLWGVIHDGHTLLPGVWEMLERLQLQEKTVVFLSNAPRRSLALEEQLAVMGLPRALYSCVYSSGEDAFGALIAQHRGKMCYPLSASLHGPLLQDANAQIAQTLEEADFILNTGPIPLVLEEHDALLKQALALDIPMICVNPDVAVMREGVLSLCAGALAKVYEEMGGQVHYHGKPFPEIYQRLWESLGLPDKARMVAIGDSLTTDIVGAQNFGIDSVLVMTGLEGHALHVHQGSLPPKEKLQALCTQKGAVPTYIAPGFGAL